MHPLRRDACLEAVFIQSLSYRRISNMFDNKDKSSATNRRVVMCMPIKITRRRQIVADESRRDVYSGTIPVDDASATYCLPSEMC